MTTPFANLEARANAAVLRSLSNAMVSIEGGDPIQGIFDDGFVVGPVGVGMAGSQPVFTTGSQLLPDDPTGKTLVRDGVSYTIAVTEPDGAGMTKLVLELA